MHTHVWIEHRLAGDDFGMRVPSSWVRELVDGGFVVHVPEIEGGVSTLLFEGAEWSANPIVEDTGRRVRALRARRLAVV